MTLDPSWELPAFTNREFRLRRTRFGLLIPVLNEGGRIVAQLARMAAAGALAAADTVIVDGGSTDGALQPDALEARGLRALLVKTGPGRLGAQLRAGLAWMMSEGYEGAALMDGNNKDDPAAVHAFVRALEEGWDHVQGSRFIAGGRHRNTPLSRSLGIRLLHAPALSLSCGFRYTDTTNGFRAYSRRLLTDGRVRPFRNVFAGYEFHYYLAIRAARLGFKVKEIPVTRDYPASGAVPTKIHGWRGNLAVLATLARSCLHLYDPRGDRSP